MITSLNEKRKNDIYTASLFYLFGALAFTAWPYLVESSTPRNARDIWVFTATFVPYSLCVFMFKGFNARVILATVAIAMAIEYALYGRLFDYAMTGEAPNWLMLHMPVISFIPAYLILAFRVQLTMKLAVNLYRYQATRPAAIYLMKRVHVTRLDVYILSTHTLHAFVLLAYYLYLYAFYFGLGGEWVDYREYIAIMGAYGGEDVYNMRFTLGDIISTIEVAILIVTGWREYRQPDALHLKP